MESFHSNAKPESKMRFRLPIARLPIIGRERECARVVETIRGGVRLLTLVGTGGVGKTRLALAVATELVPDFDGRVGWISLGEATDPDLLLDTIARALDIQTQGREPGEALVATFGDRPVLLVLDNMEHLIGAVDALAKLLDLAPGSTLLVTSRMPLRLMAEREIRVDPFPAFAKQADFETHPAVRLFIERACAVDATFDPDTATLARIATIVARVDFLPLAIELAAARVRHFSVEEIEALLSNNVDLLTGGPRDAPDRQRTIRATIGWSYALLRPDEQRLFRALSVFPGPFTLDNAVRIAEGWDSTRVETIELVSALVDQNLLVRLHETGIPRYAMLDSIRDFGHAELVSEGEDAATHSRFLDMIMKRIEPPELAPHEIDPQWLGLVERSIDDIRAAANWVIANGDDVRALTFLNDLSGWWETRGNPREGHRFYTMALAHSANAPASLRLIAMRNYAWLLAISGELPRAIALRDDIVSMTRALGDPLATIRCEQLLAALAFNQGDLREGRARTQRAIELAEEAGMLRFAKGSIYNLALFAEIDGDYELALSYHQRGLDMFEPDERHWLFIMHQLGLARLSLHRSNPGEADRILREIWPEILAVRSSQDIASAVAVKAGIALEFGDPTRSARLLGAMNMIVEMTGVVLSEPESTELIQLRERLSRVLSETELIEATTLGRLTTLEELETEITRFAEPEEVTTTEPKKPSLLTPRETEVTRLLIEGKTNPEIAKALFISERTVQSHVANIMAKLQVNSRTAVASRVVRDRLLPT